MIYDEGGRGTIGPTPRRIIPMSLTGLSLGGFLARMARLRFTRLGQFIKTRPAPAYRLQPTTAKIGHNATLLTSFGNLDVKNLHQTKNSWILKGGKV